jgi:hypothetical protein
LAQRESDEADQLIEGVRFFHVDSQLWFTSLPGETNAPLLWMLLKQCFLQECLTGSGKGNCTWVDIFGDSEVTQCDTEVSRQTSFSQCDYRNPTKAWCWIWLLMPFNSALVTGTFVSTF